MGVTGEFIGPYRAHLTWAGTHLTKLGRAELTDREIPALLEIARKAGAAEARLRNLETACRAYVDWKASMQGARPRPAPQPTPAATTTASSAALRGSAALRKPAVPRAAVVGLALGAVLMLGLVIFRPRPPDQAPERAPAGQVESAGGDASEKPAAGPSPAKRPFGTACQQLQRCCDEKGATMFCAVARVGNQAQCTNAMSSIKETEGIDCRR